MVSPYKRRRSAGMIRNLWVYRKLVLAAVILGLTLWFIVINNTPVTVYFPFGLGSISSTSGLTILLGAFAGSAVTTLVLTVLLTMRRLKNPRDRDDFGDPGAVPEDRPPDDYAVKTGEGFSNRGW